MLYSDCTIASKSKHGEEILFYKHEVDILKANEVFADSRVCTARLYTSEKKTSRTQ